MQIPGIDGLEFQDRDFSWLGRACDYRDVRSIFFTATVTSRRVNGIPVGKSYDAKLQVHFAAGSMTIEPQKGWFGRLGASGMEALQRAHAVLSDMTFTHRVENYERQVAERGFFNFNGAQFHAQGHIFRDGKQIGSVRDGGTSFRLDPFILFIGKKKSLAENIISAFVSRDFQVDLTTDKDCMLYMLKSLYGITWQDAPVRQKRVDRQQLFYETVVRLGAMLAMIDGHADPRELGQLKRFFRIDSDSIPDAARIFNEQLHRKSSLQDVLGVFAREFSDASELKESFLLGMLLVALADGTLDPREFDLIQRTASYLNLDVAAFARIMAAAGVDAGSFSGGNERHENRRESTTRAPGRDRLTHRRILGVDLAASREEIRVAYKALVLRHHPDILRGQGMPEAEIARSEAILVQVNLAYEALMASAV